MTKSRLTILFIIILVVAIAVILSPNKPADQSTSQPSNGIADGTTPTEAPPAPATVIPEQVETPAPADATQGNAAEVDGVPSGTEVTSEPPAPAPSMPAPVPAQGQ